MPHDLDVVALNKTIVALWGDADDEPRPSPVTVGGKVAAIMVEHDLSFQDACHILIRRKNDLDAAAANAAKQRFRG